MSVPKPEPTESQRNAAYAQLHANAIDGSVDNDAFGLSVLVNLENGTITDVASQRAYKAA